MHAPPQPPSRKLSSSLGQVIGTVVVVVLVAALGVVVLYPDVVREAILDSPITREEL